MIFTSPALEVFLAAAAAVILGTAGYFIFRAVIRARRAKRRERQLFFIRFARESGAAGEDELYKFEQFLRALLGFRKPIALEAVMPQVGNALRLYASVPTDTAAAFIQSVRNVGSGIELGPADEHHIFNHGGSSAAATVRRMLPDANEPIFSGLKELAMIGEGGAVQIMLRPARRFAFQNAEPVFHANVRFVASAPSEFRARDIVESLTRGFRASAARNPAAVLSAFLSREFNEREVIALSAQDLARALAFPAAASGFAQAFSAPADFSKEGIVLGESQDNGVPVRMSPAIRRQHLSVVGQAGTGKSAFLGSLASQDIHAGAGVCVIDPVGGLFTNVMSRIPKERMQDVVVFDPLDLARPVGVNALEFDPAYPEERKRITDGLMEVFEALGDFEAVRGAEFERVLKNALLLLMDNPANGFTLVELPRIFSDSAFRSRLAAASRDEAVKRFWEKEAAAPEFAHLIPHLASKFAQIILHDYVRPMVASSRSVVDFRSVAEGKKILLVHIPKEKIGAKAAAFLGMLIMDKIARTPHTRDFHLYVDEAQDFKTPSIAALLHDAESRLCLTSASRSASHLGDAGSLVAFRVAPEDAALLHDRFAPAFTAHHLASIRNGNAHVRLLSGGAASRPFTMLTSLPMNLGVSHAALIREASRTQYGRDRAAAEREIYERARRG